MDFFRSSRRKAFLHVFLGASPSAILVKLGQFDKAPVKVGLSQYAENPRHWPKNVRKWFPMPANTLVNLGYAAVGLYWLSKVKELEQIRVISASDARMYSTFAWMSIGYGGVQMARIITQDYRLAILDQWYTLPFFAWGCAWSFHVVHGPNGLRDLIIMAASLSTYMLALSHPQGFEIALGSHIAAVLASVGYAYQSKGPNISARQAFNKGVFCCAGFVALKLLDHKLADLHPFFQRFSGHFFSKICDILQIYYVFDFFYSIQAKRSSYYNIRTETVSGRR